MFSPNILAPAGDDTFGADIKIPEGMTFETVPEEPKRFGDKAIDSEWPELLKAVTTADTPDQFNRIKLGLTEIEQILKNNGLLLRYLASNPKWFLHQERGELYATRRFVDESGLWEIAGTNGFFSSTGRASFSNIPNFQIRIRILLNAEAIKNARFKHITRAKFADESVDLEVTAPKSNSGQPGYESVLIVTDANSEVGIELYEQSATPSRFFSMVAIKLLRDELNSFNIKKCAPDYSNCFAANDKNGGKLLVAGSQGLYRAFGFANPNEEGQVYLRAFEVTRNRELSKESLYRESMERIGWSQDPIHMFYYDSRITIFEGTFGIFYPAKFELWFAPQSGKPHRKLAESEYLIEGWDR